MSLRSNFSPKEMTTYSCKELAYDFNGNLEEEKLCYAVFLKITGNNVNIIFFEENLSFFGNNNYKLTTDGVMLDKYITYCEFEENNEASKFLVEIVFGKNSKIFIDSF